MITLIISFIIGLIIGIYVGFKLAVVYLLKVCDENISGFNNIWKQRR